MSKRVFVGFMAPLFAVFALATASTGSGRTERAAGNSVPSASSKPTTLHAVDSGRTTSPLR